MGIINTFFPNYSTKVKTEITNYLYLGNIYNECTLSYLVAIIGRVETETQGSVLGAANFRRENTSVRQVKIV